MKKSLSLILAALMLMSIVFAFSACSKQTEEDTTAAEETTQESVSGETTEASSEEAVTNEKGEVVITAPENPTGTVKLSNKNIYVTFEENTFSFDVEQFGIIEDEGKMSFFGDGFNEATAKEKLDAFNAIENDNDKTEVKYGEKKLGDYTAKTVIYNGGNNYYKLYYIELSDPIDGMYAVQLDGCLGASLDNEATIDAIAESLTLGEPEEAEVE